MKLLKERHSCQPQATLCSKLLFLTFALALFISQNLSAHGGSGVQWLTNYEEAVQQSKDTNRPIVLFFTGSDWCGWCTRLEDEVFNTEAFKSAAGDKFVFVKVDFPLYTSLNAATTAQNKELQRKYDVRSYPTLILLDKNQQPIGTTGYRPGGGGSYATHLLNMISGYADYKHSILETEHKQLSGLELKKLFEKSKELDLDNDTNTLVRLGLKSDERPFFLLERYRFLVEEGQIHSKEASDVRKELETNDPNNLNQTHFQLAVIDFEATSQSIEKDSLPVEIAISPLQRYIEQFGSNDKENLWRLHMIISQVYLNKSHLTYALKHAEASYQNAPANIKPDIALTIKNIESQLTTNAD